MLTKKSLITSLKGKKIRIDTLLHNSAIEISRLSSTAVYWYQITEVGEDMFEAVTDRGVKHYFSIAHVRQITV